MTEYFAAGKLKGLEWRNGQEDEKRTNSATIDGRVRYKKGWDYAGVDLLAGWGPLSLHLAQKRTVAPVTI